jgi:ATP-binding cassette subfamily C protein CydC
LTALAVTQVAGSAVLALVTLATLEVVVPLVGAAVRHTELRGALARITLDDDINGDGDLDGDIDGGRVLGRSPAPTQNVNRVTGLSMTVGYDGGRGYALDGVDLDLPYGSRVAVVGPSGSGKSTLLAALAGLVPLAGGTVTVDGAPPGWPAVGGVFADAHVFHASVRHNLTLGRDGYPDERLRDALSAAGLPDWGDRLDDVVGEDGARLSGGQRQRLLLARVLVDPPPVLLFDEPTEGLDPATADAVLASALRAAGDRTVVVVTHRAAEVAEFTDVVELDGGRRVGRTGVAVRT